MLIKTIPVGMLETNCYVVTDEESKKCAIIDPGADSNVILDYVESNGLTVEAIFLTHGHFDHIMVADTVMEDTGAPVYINEKEVNRTGQHNMTKVNDNGALSFYSEGDVICIGNLEFTVFETPGHSPGSVTLKCGDVLFTGDTLFCGDCGRTDLEGGSRELILLSLKRLAMLDGNYEVYPGHEESSTLDNERRFNQDMKMALGD